ncbi:MAG: N-acetyltransferase [Proteobacteria bacterium]|nr:N-acetyltransferase [Pseudomonadota bacterium]
MPTTIRRATAEDAAASRALAEAAFHDSEPTETVEFLDRLRNDDCILAEWVAEAGGEIVGHIVFSRAWIETDKGSSVAAAMLTPLAVRPDRQRTGIGQRLMAQALAELDAAGERIFLVLGHPEYYPRAGFTAERAARIATPWGSTPAFMARGDAIPAGRLILPRSIAEAH